MYQGFQASESKRGDRFYLVGFDEPIKLGNNRVIHKYKAMQMLVVNVHNLNVADELLTGTLSGADLGRHLHQ